MEDIPVEGAMQATIQVEVLEVMVVAEVVEGIIHTAGRTSRVFGRDHTVCYFNSRGFKWCQEYIGCIWNSFVLFTCIFLSELENF